MVIPPAIFFYYSTLFDSRFKTLQQNPPLTFLTDDIMLAMAKSQKPYFKLNKENSKDHRDHYFMFNVEPSRDNNLVRLYCYDSTMTHISKNRPK
ncbi:DUF5960 family protein [Streptococcus suis]|uniref:DUF5960 family protein n=1 Tax=Streptococcus TaxID=1301 RepID=UPI00387972DB